MKRKRCWVYFCGREYRVEREISTAIEAAGIEIMPLETFAPGPHGIVFFGEVSESLIARLREVRRFSRVIAINTSPELMKAEATWKLLHAGASDVLTWDSKDTVAQIEARLERWAEVEELADEAVADEGLIGNSVDWWTLVRNVVEAGRYTRTPVLLTGESGTGKELLARLIHSVGLKTEPFGERRDLVTVDCSTIVPELSGSELFGHERGAFTGAHVQREGAFALANRATLFLDEIGELPLPLQAQLLRAIQEKTYKRVGGNTWHTVEFRLVCATNRDLQELCRNGQFRVDLYHRIAGWVFRTLPLRDHREDILLLADAFLRQAMEGRQPPDLNEAVKQYLVSREYAGNVRELRQLMHRISHRHVGAGPITPGAIPEDDWPQNTSTSNGLPEIEMHRAIADAVSVGASLKEICQTASDVAIRIAVQSESGNLQRAARKLRVTDRTLQIRRAAGRM